MLSYELYNGRIKLTKELRADLILQISTILTVLFCKLYVLRLVTHRDTVGLISKRDEGGYGVGEMLSVRQQAHSVTHPTDILHVRLHGSAAFIWQFGDDNIQRVYKTATIGC